MKHQLHALCLDLWLAWQRQPGRFLACALLLALIGLIPHLQPAPEAIAVKDDPRQSHALHAFEHSLLPQDALLAAQQALLETAQRQQLEIGRIDYSEEESTGGIGRATLRLPLNGRYADLRSFMAESLRAQPALAIRQLLIERPETHAGSSTVRATLTVTFMLAEKKP